MFWVTCVSTWDCWCAGGAARTKGAGSQGELQRLGEAGRGRAPSAAAGQGLLAGSDAVLGDSWGIWAGSLEEETPHQP